MHTVLLSFIAGILTDLAPCVLPLLPLIIGSAFQQHRLGPLMVAAGLALSFALVGGVLAAIGPSLGITPHTIRIIAATLLILFGLTLVSSILQERISKLLTPLASATQNFLGKLNPTGLAGQFFVGSLLGAVWAPCSGPTLGSAVALASNAATRSEAFFLMLVFGLGAAVPLLLIAYGSRQLFLSKRTTLIAFGAEAKQVFGMILVFVGSIILTGLDKRLEAALLDIAPEWFFELVTRY